MSLRFYCLLQQAAELALRGLHLAERPLHSLRAWAWCRATHANLRTCNTRIVARS